MAHLHVASAACVPLLRLLHFVVQRRTNIAAKQNISFFSFSFMKSSCVLYLPSGWEEKCVSLVEYWEKLQHRRSMVARLMKVIQVSSSRTNFVFSKFSTLLAYLQPLWRTTKSKGLTKEWTKAT